MQYVGELRGFGLGGNGGDGEPLALVKAGHAQGKDRKWAFGFLTDKYVSKDLMKPANRSNILAKVYGRLRVNAVDLQPSKRVYRPHLHTTTSPPNADYDTHEPVAKIARTSCSETKTKIEPAADATVIDANSSTMKIMYTGDVWKLRSYGICSKPYWYCETLGQVRGEEYFRRLGW